MVWPLPEGMDDEQLERRLFAPPPPPSAKRPLPDWPVVHQELRRKEVTLQLLHRLQLLCSSHRAPQAAVARAAMGSIRTAGPIVVESATLCM